MLGVLSSCTRCGGTMVRNRDYFGLYDHCVMCGNYIYYTPKIVVPPELKGHMKIGRKKKAQSGVTKLQSSWGRQQDAV